VKSRVKSGFQHPDQKNSIKEVRVVSRCCDRDGEFSVVSDGMGIGVTLDKDHPGEIWHSVLPSFL
jgi:hypothetical protein